MRRNSLTDRIGVLIILSLLLIGCHGERKIRLKIEQDGQQRLTVAYCYYLKDDGNPVKHGEYQSWDYVAKRRETSVYENGAKVSSEVTFSDN